MQVSESRRGTVILRRGSVLDLWGDGNTSAACPEDLALFRRCNVLYLDPEWGGKGYKWLRMCRLFIGGKPLDRCVCAAPCVKKWQSSCSSLFVVHASRCLCLTC